MRKLVTSEATQHIPVVAVCFGHQIMSLALGGKCEQGTNGWEIGVYANDFTEEGRYWWSDSVVPNGDNKIVSGGRPSDSSTPSRCTRTWSPSSLPDARCC